MTYQNLRDQYAYKIKTWMQNNKFETSEHVVDVIISILLHRDRIIDHGGSFVQAFINNNLHDVIRYADNDVLANIRIIFFAYNNIDTYHAARAYKELINANPTL